MIKNNNQKLAVKGKKLKNLADLYTVEFYRGSLLPISCPISDSDKLFVQRRTIRQTETDVWLYPHNEHTTELIAKLLIKNKSPQTEDKLKKL